MACTESSEEEKANARWPGGIPVDWYNLDSQAFKIRPFLVSSREIGILLPNSQRQHRTLHIQKDVLQKALCQFEPLW